MAALHQPRDRWSFAPVAFKPGRGWPSDEECAANPIAARVGIEAERQLKSITFDDLLDELVDAKELLQVVVENEEAEVLGRMVIAVRRNYALRLAHREVYGDAENVEPVTVAVVKAMGEVRK